MPIGGIPLAGMPFVGAAQLGQRGGLPGPRRAGHDHPAAGRDLMPVQLDQQPGGGDHPPDHRRVRQRQVSVIGLPGLVMPGPLPRRHPGQRNSIRRRHQCTRGQVLRPRGNRVVGRSL